MASSKLLRGCRACYHGDLAYPRQPAQPNIHSRQCTMSDQTNIFTPTPKNSLRSALQSNSSSVLPVWRACMKNSRAAADSGCPILRAGTKPTGWSHCKAAPNRTGKCNASHCTEKREFVESALSSIDARYQSILKEIDQQPCAIWTKRR